MLCWAISKLKLRLFINSFSYLEGHQSWVTDSQTIPKLVYCYTHGSIIMFICSSQFVYTARAAQTPSKSGVICRPNAE